MPTPFPGMDPYLEQPGLWNEVHTDLIVNMRRFLARRLPPNYRAAIEKRIYLAPLPLDDQFVGVADVLLHDTPLAPSSTPTYPQVSTVVEPMVVGLPVVDEIQERYLEIRQIDTQEVVTVIELLSPANKTSRKGRRAYEDKRDTVLSSLTHLVEIDLIRRGTPFAMSPTPTSDYRILISRHRQRPRANLYAFGLRTPVPDVPIPLRSAEPEIILPLNQILHELYDESRYDLAIDYQQKVSPALAPADQAWVAELLAK